MRLDVFRHLWGLVGDGCRFSPDRLDEAVQFVRDSSVGYRGVECPLLTVPDQASFVESLKKRELDFIPMVLTFGMSVDDHLQAFRMQLEWARALPHRFVVSHSGLDAFDDDDARRFFEEALRIEKDLDVQVAHETHRGRILFNPWTTRRLLDRFGDLKLNCDLSHWCVVAERLIDDQIEILELCAERALHIHARVGYENGPQVSDPAAPEYSGHLQAHERWWALIWDAQVRRGMDVTTLTPEFGPPSYQPTLPYTQVPTASLERICDWMAERQKERFNARAR